ncbi:hypothetical protein [Yeosuana marina]|uniref:hypothetical protein n=1 Tax=Yeosuana marina TaxID=1565536 RepID=UPI0030C83EA9|tara:strand:+ start:1826 stop:2065 length:240 start_codon:yes stop_codon:yes gene_type:complete
MLLNYNPFILLPVALIEQSDIVTLLIIVVVFFSILLILGIRKSYKLKKENERLDKISEELAKQEEKYKDFTEGHMYGDN